MSFDRWLRRTEDNVWHKHSFQCHRCPKEGCPSWASMEVINPSTGDLVPVSGCSFRFIPQLLSESLALTNQVGKAQSHQTQTIKKSTVVLGRLMQQATQAALPAAEVIPDADIAD